MPETPPSKNKTVRNTTAALFTAAALGGLGVAIALVISGDAATVDDKSIFCSEFVPNMEASNVYAKWASQNRGERDKWIAYRTAICASQNPAVPVVATSFGKALVAAGKMALTIDVPPPTTTTTTTQPTTTTEPPPPPPTNNANLWVDPSGGSCTRSATLAAYVDAAACLSFAAAHSAASAGDMVRVKGGTYGSQILPASQKQVSFSEAVGETVSLGGGTCPASGNGAYALLIPQGGGGSSNTARLTFSEIAVSWAQVRGSNVTFTNTDFGHLSIQAAANISMLGGDIGPTYASTSCDAHPEIDGASSNLLFDGVYFHDAGWDGQQHTECLLVTGVNGLVIKNSRWFNCDSTGDFFITRWNSCTGNPVANVTLENNFFLDDTGYTSGPPGTSGSQWLSPQSANNVQNFVWRNNTIGKRGVVFDSSGNNSCGYPEYIPKFYGNYGNMLDVGNCVGPNGNVWVDFNVQGSAYSSDTCSGESNHGGYIEVVNKRSDLHLTSNSYAIDRGGSSSPPSTDIDGQTRPIGAAVDAGADER